MCCATGVCGATSLAARRTHPPGCTCPTGGIPPRSGTGVSTHKKTSEFRDQSAITGESVPVDRKPGDEVFAGTINQDNALDVRMTRLARDNTLTRVMQLVAEAQEQKSPAQRFTETFARRFVPTVLIGTALVIIAAWRGSNSSEDLRGGVTCVQPSSPVRAASASRE